MTFLTWFVVWPVHKWLSKEGHQFNLHAECRNQQNTKYCSHIDDDGINVTWIAIAMLFGCCGGLLG
jgi:hypothetical protein